MKRVDLYWLAGLLEGEGAFGTARNIVNKRVYLYPIIQLGMNDKDIVQRAATLLGAYYKDFAGKPGQKRRWMTSRRGSKALAVMLQLYPLMGKRRQRQIKKVLTIQQKRPMGYGHRSKPE